MRGVVRSTLYRWSAALFLLTGGLIALIVLAPRLLRNLDLFRVERVEIIGTRYIAPHHLLEESGIRSNSNLFDDPEPWQNALMAHPMVASLEIEREYPSTLILRVEEVEPVGFVSTPILRPVAADGRVLPLDPAVVDLDLPLIELGTIVTSSAEPEDSALVEVAGALDRIGRLAPWLLAQISTLGPAEGGGIRLLLREPAGGVALLPEDFNALRIEQLRLTLADLEERRELPQLRQIDVRYRDQVVVSLTSG